MNKINDQIVQPNYLERSRSVEQSKNETVKRKMPVESLDKLALSNRASMSMKIIFQSVTSQISSKFAKIDYAPQEKGAMSNHALSDAIVAKEPVEESKSKNTFFDFEEVARNVMDFVGGSIIAAQANGASDEELKEMFEQGKAGANLGIDQAIGELKELAILDENLNEGIEKSRDLINKNIDDLYEKIFPSEVKTTDTTKADEQSIKSASLNSELYVSNSKSSDLTITTTDGDLVSISFSELQEYTNKEQHQYQEGTKGISENYINVNSQYHEVNFSFSVEGELDDEEQAAIEALIKDVNSLQKDFFSGNVDQAFEKALALGFDNEQIANFSMDLQQTKTSYVSQAYTEVAELEGSSLAKSEKELKPLIDFLEHFKQLKEQADQLLSKNEDAFGQLLDAVFKAEFGNNKEAKMKLDKVITIVKPDNEKD